MIRAVLLLQEDFLQQQSQSRVFLAKFQGLMIMFDRPAFEDFLLGAHDDLDGVLSFYDGRAPEDVRPTTPADEAYRRNLISFLGLRASLLAP